MKKNSQLDQRGEKKSEHHETLSEINVILSELSARKDSSQ
jgi:hypothetical protein